MALWGDRFEATSSFRVGADTRVRSDLVPNGALAVVARLLLN